MANLEPRWNPEETCEAGWSFANLVETHGDKLRGALEDVGGPEAVQAALDQKADKIRALGVQILAGDTKAEPPADLVEALTEVPLIVRALREMVKRLHRGDTDIRNAFGVGTVLDITKRRSLLRAISLVNAGVELYPELAAKAPAELLQAATKHEATLLQVVVEALPAAPEANPDVAARNATQVEVQDLVDKVLAAVAIRAWRTPELLAEFKRALPSTRPPKK